MQESFNVTLLTDAEFKQAAAQVAAQQVALRKASPRMQLLNMHYAPDGYFGLTAPIDTGNWDAVTNFKKLVDKMRNKLVRDAKKV